ncbi:hypothetical protein KSP40_PGU003806 [Platanthera guangdongensis]|uniref:Uncharacterized protein n=1 Tax=Platanthera guangdongensis TaxID=2320717 RepID=A0ABR2M8N3_9ASPA
MNGLLLLLSEFLAFVVVCFADPVAACGCCDRPRYRQLLSSLESTPASLYIDDARLCHFPSSWDRADFQASNSPYSSYDHSTVASCTSHQQILHHQPPELDNIFSPTQPAYHHFSASSFPHPFHLVHQQPVVSPEAATVVIPSLGFTATIDVPSQREFQLRECRRKHVTDLHPEEPPWWTYMRRNRDTDESA